MSDEMRAAFARIAYYTEKIGGDVLLISPDIREAFAGAPLEELKAIAKKSGKKLHCLSIMPKESAYIVSLEQATKIEAQALEIETKLK